VRRAAVAADGQGLHVVAREVLDAVADLAQLALADAGERQRVEEDHHVLATAEVRQAHDLAVLVLEREVRRHVADLDRHGHSFAGQGRMTGW
jgi:hypothetical protein